MRTYANSGKTALLAKKLAEGYVHTETVLYVEGEQTFAAVTLRKPDAPIDERDITIRNVAAGITPEGRNAWKEAHAKDRPHTGKHADKVRVGKTAKRKEAEAKAREESRKSQKPLTKEQIDAARKERAARLAAAAAAADKKATKKNK